jgi:hypothetical protein
MPELERVIEDRIFCLPNPATGSGEWFFLAREKIMGPYSNRVDAHVGLMEYVRICESQGDSGGRNEADEEEFRKWAEQQLQSGAAEASPESGEE